MRKVAEAKVLAEEVMMTPMINSPTMKQRAIKAILPVKNTSRIIMRVIYYFEEHKMFLLNSCN